jgi:hypothetical protein
MPLELGLFLGCRRFGANNQSRKRTLVLVSDQYRYRAFISDISGPDIRAYGGDPERAIREVRDWLRLASKRDALQGGAELRHRFRSFQSELPDICADLSLHHDRLTFLELWKLINDWLQKDPSVSYFLPPLHSR